MQHERINDHINVEILGKKYILNNKSINVFGKMVAMGEVDVNGSLDNDECSKNGLVEDCDSENDDDVDSNEIDDIDNDENGEENDQDANSGSDLDDTSALDEFNLNGDDDLSEADNTSDLEEDL